MPELLKTEQFEIDGKVYETRAINDDMGVEVQIFHNGEPVLHPKYSVTWDTRRDMIASLGIDAIEQLMQLAQAHFLENQRRFSI